MPVPHPNCVHACAMHGMSMAYDNVQHETHAAVQRIMATVVTMAWYSNALHHARAKHARITRAGVRTRARAQ